MKVKEITRKINAATAQLPVYMQEGLDEDTRRQAVSWDFNGYYFSEQDYTVCSISVQDDKIVIYYTRKDGRRTRHES